MRIAVDGNVLHAGWGGIPKYLARIVEILAERGDTIEVLVHRSSPRQIPGTREVSVRFRGALIWQQAFLPAWLAVRRPGVLWAPATLLPRICPVPSVVTVHDMAPALMDGLKAPAEEHEFRTAVRDSVRRADRVIAVSQTTADDLVRTWSVDPARISVVGLGIDDSFTPGDRGAAQERVRERFGLPAPFVLAVGSLEPRKGLDVLFDAAARGHAAGRKWRVALAGAPAYRGQEIADRARQAGCRLLGRVSEPELADLYRAAEVLVCPSLYEGFGLAPLEAMACGTPAVIAGGSGGLEEVSGAAAVVVVQRTPEAWLEAIEDGIATRDRRVAPGVERAARYRWVDAAAGTREVLAQAAGGPPGGWPT